MSLFKNKPLFPIISDQKVKERLFIILIIILRKLYKYNQPYRLSNEKKSNNISLSEDKEQGILYNTTIQKQERKIP